MDIATVDKSKLSDMSRVKLGTRLSKEERLIKAVIDLKGNEAKKDDVKLISEHIYDLAMMSHQPLEPEAMSKFNERSNKILMKLI